ncbi:MAG: inositol monophosphatase [Acidimicrobiales bacterium]|nr:inositol monophosphatase [Acidimicrobiales bacterium]
MSGERPALATADAFGWASGPAPDPVIAQLADAALEAARAGASVVASGAALGPGQVSGVGTKISSTDMVSDVDREAEAAVSAVLASRRPGDGLLGEEGTSRPGSTGVRWVVDPLDGTTNFLFSIPQFCVSVAAEVTGHTAVGVVIDPSRGEVWAAAAGHGAHLNGHRCQVPTGRSTLPTALVATGFGYRAERRRWQADVAAKIIPRVRDIRRLGSAALDLCWMAAGRYDAYFEWGLNPWDLAAGALIASEAGATVEVVGDRVVVAASPELFAPLRDLLFWAGAFEAPKGPEPALWEDGGSGSSD